MRKASICVRAAAFLRYGNVQGFKPDQQILSPLVWRLARELCRFRAFETGVMVGTASILLSLPDRDQDEVDVVIEDRRGRIARSWPEEMLMGKTSSAPVADELDNARQL